MKKSTFMKLAFVFVAMFTFTGAYSQAVQNPDYQNVAESVYQTAGKTFRLYVDPDNTYNPNYNVGGGWLVDANARWTWTYPAGLVTGTPATGVAANQNYVEFVAPTVGGPYTVTVVESNTIIACTDAGTTKVVNIVAAPVATITTGDPVQACGDQAAAAIAMTFTEAVPVAVAGYSFAVNELIENIDPAGVVIGAALVDNDAFLDFPTTGKLVTPALTGAASPYGYTFNTTARTVRNSLRTRYTYTLIKASDAPGAAADGLISAISQKSDYVGATILTHIFGAKTTYVSIVNPVPVTGPIYHIPNNYAL